MPRPVRTRTGPPVIEVSIVRVVKPPFGVRSICVSPQYLPCPGSAAVSSQRPTGSDRSRLRHDSHSGVDSGAICERTVESLLTDSSLAENFWRAACDVTKSLHSPLERRQESGTANEWHLAQAVRISSFGIFASGWILRSGL